MIAGEFPPAFTVHGAVKDTGLIAAAMRESGTDAAVMDAVAAQFRRAADSGHGDQDMAAVFRAFLSLTRPVTAVPRISYARSADGVKLAFTTTGHGPALVFVPWVPFSNFLFMADPDEVVEPAHRVLLRRHRTGGGRAAARARAPACRGDAPSPRELEVLRLLAAVANEGIARRLGREPGTPSSGTSRTSTARSAPAGGLT